MPIYGKVSIQLVSPASGDVAPEFLEAGYHLPIGLFPFN